MLFVAASTEGFYNESAASWGQTAFSEFMWLRPASTPAVRQTLMFRHTVNFEEEILSAEASGGGFQFSADGITNITDNGTAYATGVWMHVGVTYDGTNFLIYVNGVNTVSGTGTPTHTGAYDACSLGVRDRIGAWDQPFDGDIVNVFIHNRALAAAEVRALYNGSWPLMPSIRRQLCYYSDLQRDAQNQAGGPRTIFATKTATPPGMGAQRRRPQSIESFATRFLTASGGPAGDYPLRTLTNISQAVARSVTR